MSAANAQSMNVKETRTITFITSQIMWAYQHMVVSPSFLQGLYILALELSHLCDTILRPLRKLKKLDVYWNNLCLCLSRCNTCDCHMTCFFSINAIIMVLMALFIACLFTSEKKKFIWNHTVINPFLWCARIYFFISIKMYLLNII